jgi:tRNA pseudouridine38-40 synthase
VHARGQVCHVDVETAAWRALPGRSPAEPAQSLVHRLAGLLPPDVRVHRAVAVPAEFDARFSALARCYAYRICDDPAVADPLRRDVLLHRRPLDAAAMDAAAAPLVGEHDFSAFCKPREGATTIRRVLSLRCTREADGPVVVDVLADAFCHHMVRAICGALVAVGEGRHDTTWPREVLVAGQRDGSVTVLPPGGLTLESVTYPPDDELAARAAVTMQMRAAAG